MLFDTSSPGRRRGVQIIFGFLALLMGGGLVFFGIGSSQTGGGISDIFKGGNQSSSLSSQAKSDAESAQKALAKNPKDIDAADKLAKARLVIAVDDGLNPQTGELKDAASQALVTAADDAYTKYMALGPTPPSRSTTASYSQFYAYQGVAQYAKAARALEANLSSRDSAGAGVYAQLAIFWLFGGDKGNYRDARTRAISLSDSAERKATIAKQLDDYEKQYDKAIADQAKAAKDAQATTGSGTTPKLPTLPTLGGQ